MPWRISTANLNLDVVVDLWELASTSTINHEFKHVSDYVTEAYLPAKALWTSMGSKCYCSFEKAMCIATALQNLSLNYYNKKAHAYTLRRVHIPEEFWPYSAWTEEEAANADRFGGYAKDTFEDAVERCETDR